MKNGNTIIAGCVNNPTWINSSALATSAKRVALIKMLRLGMYLATSSLDALTCSSREKDNINANLTCGYAHKAMARIKAVVFHYQNAPFCYICLNDFLSQQKIAAVLFFGGGNSTNIHRLATTILRWVANFLCIDQTTKKRDKAGDRTKKEIVRQKKRPVYKISFGHQKPWTFKDSSLIHIWIKNYAPYKWRLWVQGGLTSSFLKNRWLPTLEPTKNCAIFFRSTNWKPAWDESIEQKTCLVYVYRGQ